ncbi:MAG: hypothetical protein K8I04_15125 [Gammaproteobacteria bacterium]|nr:hypothetical protein [Gammaproteobacteria bacterium]
MVRDVRGRPRDADALGQAWSAARRRGRRWGACAVILVLLGGPAQAAERPGGPVADAGQCVSCHAAIQPALVAAWRGSGHGSGGASCMDCHGAVHDGGVKARHDQTCSGCHGGTQAPVAHSYATSKHGVIVKLEAPHWDWTRPLCSANYRAPGCAYCHLHTAEHDTRRRIVPHATEPASDVAQRARDAMNAVCYDCHAPRYVGRLGEGGERMLGIARMKQREAHSLVEATRDEHTDMELAQALAVLARMGRHVQNVGLGVGHQSPDYQWWHGQAALDGDLLRIKGEVSRLRRIREMAAAGREADAVGMDAHPPASNPLTSSTSQ